VKVVVTVPWRPTPDRIRAFQAVRDWYAEVLPEWWFGTADSGHEQFSRAASRNACVRLAVEHGADVVVINDADTIPERHGVTAAVQAAHDQGGLHFGLHTMRYLSAEETELYYSGSLLDRTGTPHDSSVVVMRPIDYIHAGGQDERFTGYGGEDNAFCAAASTLLQRGACWHKGAAISLYHDPSVRDIGSARWKPNSELNIRYQHAKGNVRRMRNLINERTYSGALHV
jgi:hypothetical protein